MFLAHLIVGIVFGLIAVGAALLAGSSVLGILGAYTLAAILGTLASVGFIALPRPQRPVEQAPAAPEMHPAE